MRPHQRGVALPGGQPAGAVVLRNGQLADADHAEHLLRLRSRERQIVRARVWRQVIRPFFLSTSST